MCLIKMSVNSHQPKQTEIKSILENETINNVNNHIIDYMSILDLISAVIIHALKRNLSKATQYACRSRD
jgi:hypothetical protein